MTTIFSTVMLIGGVTRPAARRWRSRSSRMTAAAATMTTITIHPATGLRLPVVSPSMIELEIGMEPPGPWPLRATSKISRPCRPSRPARVTTNDGSASLVIRRPKMAPMTAPVASPSKMATHQGTENTAQAVITAQTAPLYPTDRSISPSSRTQTSAMPRMM